MIANHQKSYFSLTDQAIYLNGAYMSPQLKTVEHLGIENLKKKSRPYTITAKDFFTEKEVLRKRFASLIDVEDEQHIAIIPSVSFGMGTAMANIPFEKGNEIVVLEEQFPSNYYVWKQLELEKGVLIKTILAPQLLEGRAKKWNEKILNSITSNTKCVALPNVHWADGTQFNLKEVGIRCREVGAYLIVDGTQSVGAMNFSVKEIQPDALICAGYKWLMGPYGIGVAYFGERFNQGTPLDNNWMNHEGAENFSNLVNYNPSFKPKAVRYDIGESSNFIMVPMLSEGIRQLLEWTPQAIQEYCKSITSQPLQLLSQAGYFIENSAHRGYHLFGIYLPKDASIHPIKERLASKNISVSYRGNAIRVSPNVYNDSAEIEKLVSCFI